MSNDLKRFNFDAFSKDLSQQAGQIIPNDISKEDKEFITTIIYRFCNIAGDALVKEENSKLTAQEAGLIVQFIGEWIFHKSIDLARAKVDIQLRESILQKVAFTIFDIAKKAVENKMAQEQLIILIEEQVKKSFKKAIEDLEKKGTISKDITQNALTQSNIDVMAQEEARAEIEKEINQFDDKKLVRLASFAILMKSFSSDKVKSILQKFNKEDRDILISYLKMPNLEEKLDTKTAMKCFEEIKSTLPETVVISYDKAYKKVCKIIKNSSREKIFDIIYNERPAIKDFIIACSQAKVKKIPAYIADTVSKYLEENIS